MLLGKTWIEKDQTISKEEEALEQKKQELRDFMTKRIAHLLKEQEDRSKLLRTSYPDVEDERRQEDLQYLSVQKSRAPTLDREEVLLSNPMKESQHREVTMLSTDKNQNGKRNLVTHITGKMIESSTRREKSYKSCRRFRRRFHRR
jgi:hypothetical protein